MTSIVLRSISLDHASFVQKYAADKLIANTTASIPYPYPDGAAESFIKEAIQKRADKKSFVYAIYVANRFVGVCSLFNLDWDKREAEVGYWIAVPFWGKNYATKALSQLIQKAKDLEITTLVGKCLVRNPASKLVLEKNGFRFVRESVGCGKHLKDAVLELLLKLI